jgi:hypothetical protein
MNPAWPAEVVHALERSEIVAVTSGITDFREAEGLLEAARPVRWQRLEWGMGSAENRARFHQLEQQAGFHMLPMFIGREGVIGGLPELRAHLHGSAAATGSGGSDTRPLGLLGPLGLGGLIPFLCFGFGIWWFPAGWQPFALQALAGYAAVILSFLGAIHWGLTLANPGHRAAGLPGPAWAVIPSVLAWAALLLPLAAALPVLALLFALVLGVDWAGRRDLRLPRLYMPMRGFLTLTAILALLSGSFTGLAG